MEQRLPPPQQIPVPLVAVLRRLGDDALDGGGEAHAGKAVVLNQVLCQRRLARCPRPRKRNPHRHPHQNRTLHSIPHRGGSSRRSSNPAWSVLPARDRRTLTARPPSAVTPAVTSPSRAMGTTILGRPARLPGRRRPQP